MIKGQSGEWWGEDRVYWQRHRMLSRPSLVLPFCACCIRRRQPSALGACGGAEPELVGQGGRHAGGAGAEAKGGGLGVASVLHKGAVGAMLCSERNGHWRGTQHDVCSMPAKPGGAGRQRHFDRPGGLDPVPSKTFELREAHGEPGARGCQSARPRCLVSSGAALLRGVCGHPGPTAPLSLRTS